MVPATEAMLTIEPPPLASIAGRKARMVRKCERALRLKARSQSSSVASSTLPWWTKPAQLNRMSTGTDLGRRR